MLARKIRFVPDKQLEKENKTDPKSYVSWENISFKYYINGEEI